MLQWITRRAWIDPDAAPPTSSGAPVTCQCVHYSVVPGSFFDPIHFCSWQLLDNINADNRVTFNDQFNCYHTFFFFRKRNLKCSNVRHSEQEIEMPSSLFNWFPLKKGTVLPTTGKRQIVCIVGDDLSAVREKAANETNERQVIQRKAFCSKFSLDRLTTAGVLGVDDVGRLFLGRGDVTARAVVQRTSFIVFIILLIALTSCFIQLKLIGVTRPEGTPCFRDATEIF